MFTWMARTGLRPAPENNNNNNNNNNSNNNSNNNEKKKKKKKNENNGGLRPAQPAESSPVDVGTGDSY